MICCSLITEVEHVEISHTYQYLTKSFIIKIPEAIMCTITYLIIDTKIDFVSGIYKNEKSS